MKSIIIAAVLCLVAICAAGGHKNEHHNHMNCQGKPFTFPEEEKKVMKDCMTEAKEKMGDSTDKKKMWGYGMACKMMKLKVVVDGKIDADALNKRIDTMYPEVAREEMKTEAKKCIDTVKDKTLSMDNDGESFAPFQKCFFEASKTVCTTQEGEQ